MKTDYPLNHEYNHGVKQFVMFHIFLPSFEDGMNQDGGKSGQILELRLRAHAGGGDNVELVHCSHD